jgi:KDO2-lipid IV(A) lauroyltransferase
MQSLEKRMVITNPELFGALAAENRSFALVAAHYNNWEWFNHLPAKMVHAFIAIYRPLKSKPMDRLSRKIRSRYKPVLVPMEGVFREAVNTRNRNQLFSIFFLADQRPPRMNRYWTTFLGQEASFFEGVEKLSRKLELAVVFMDMKKTGRGRYELTLKKLFDNAAETREHEVMKACIREMEKEILADPPCWLWSHNRFKHTRPEPYNLLER